MGSDEFRAMADRLRQLAGIAAKHEVRRELRQLAQDFDAHAEAVGREDVPEPGRLAVHIGP